ncbi:MAG TPA: oxygenase MpaB family protein [Mycobacterium sp.]|nr:oxygenase MpaB family protein [Mycobacterium sp.]
MSVEPVAQRFPREFTYFDTKDRPFGTALTERMSRLAGTDVTLDDESAEAMGAALDAGDRLGDAWYADARRRGTVRAARNEFNTALEHGVDAVNDPSPALVALFDQIHTEPEWLDWDLLERGSRIHRRYGKELYPYFGMATFSGYRTPSVTKPLILTGAYTGNSALNRFWETCKHWTDTSEPGGMRKGNPGYATSLRVRLLHCMIRARIGGHAEWDRARYGVPISQFNMFSTLMAGSVIAGHELKRLGYRTSDDDIVALMHFQRYIGYVMGVEPPWYPETISDGYRAMRLIALAQRTEDNDDSRALCHSFMDCYKPSAEARGLRRLVAEVNYRAQLGHAYFYTPSSYTKSGFPPVGLWRYAPLARFVPNFVRDTACQHIPPVARRVDDRHRAWRRAETARTLGSGRGSFSPVETLSR